ncbi:MAG: hypothetical protein EOP61_41760, partial [Sphingomonadales bacterium]
MQQFSSLGIASYHHYRALNRRTRLGLGTCLAGAAALLLTAAPAEAQVAPDISTLRAPLHLGSERALASGAAVAEPQDLTIRIDDGTAVVTEDDYQHGVTLTNF